MAARRLRAHEALNLDLQDGVGATTICWLTGRRRAMCDREIHRDEVFRLVLEIRGPKTEDEMKRFREALKKLLEGHTAVPTEVTYKVE